LPPATLTPRELVQHPTALPIAGLSKVNQTPPSTRDSQRDCAEYTLFFFFFFFPGGPQRRFRPATGPQGGWLI